MATSPQGPVVIKTFKVPLRQLFTFSIDINSSAPFGSFYWLLLWVLWDSNRYQCKPPQAELIDKALCCGVAGKSVAKASAFEGCNHKHFHRNCWVASCRNFSISCGYHSWNWMDFVIKTRIGSDDDARWGIRSDRNFLSAFVFGRSHN